MKFNQSKIWVKEDKSKTKKQNIASILALTWAKNIENSKICRYITKTDEICLLKVFPYIKKAPCIQKVCTETESMKTSTISSIIDNNRNSRYFNKRRLIMDWDKKILHPCHRFDRTDSGRCFNRGFLLQVRQGVSKLPKTGRRIPICNIPFLEWQVSHSLRCWSGKRRSKPKSNSLIIYGEKSILMYISQ